MDDLLQRLPPPFDELDGEHVDVRLGVADFVLTKLPFLLAPALARAGDLAFQERVQDYLRSAGYAGQEEASESEGEEADEGESASEPSSSSGDSVFDSYGLIRDGFLHQQDFGRGVARLVLAGLELAGGLLVQFVRPVVTVVCTKCLKITPMQMEPTVLRGEHGGSLESDVLSQREVCSGCGAALELRLGAAVFNQCTGGECLYMLKQQACLPVGLGYVGTAQALVQCMTCSTIGLQQSLRELPGDNRYGCRCPVCFNKITLQFADNFFQLPNGE